MKHQWMAYVIVALLSIGAGVAIAGLPDNTSVDATIIPPTTTVAAPPTSEPDASEPDTSETSTSTSSSTSTTSTTAPATTTSTAPEATTTVPDDGLPPRSELTVIVANGANVSGAAGRNVDLLRELGYTDIAARNGTNIFEFTTVFYAEGFEDAAVRLADDLEILPEFVAPLAEAPNVIDLPDDVELLAYIGIDRAG